MFPMDRQPMKVSVEYDSRGKRVVRTFPNGWASRSFYCRMFKEDRNPKIIKDQNNEST